MKDTYTTREIAEALGITTRAVQRQSAKQLWPYQEKPNPKGGGKVKEYFTRYLPLKARVALRKMWAKQVQGELERLARKDESESAYCLAKMILLKNQIEVEIARLSADIIQKISN